MQWDCTYLPRNKSLLNVLLNRHAQDCTGWIFLQITVEVGTHEIFHITLVNMTNTFSYHVFSCDWSVLICTKGDCNLTMTYKWLFILTVLTAIVIHEAALQWKTELRGLNKYVSTMGTRFWQLFALKKIKWVFLNKKQIYLAMIFNQQINHYSFFNHASSTVQK